MRRCIFRTLHGGVSEMIKRQIITGYRSAIRDKNTPDASEMTFYPPFESFMSEITNNINVITQPNEKNSTNKPDFKLLTKDNKLVGYIEAKRPGDLLDDTTEQIQRYIKAYSNFIFTDFNTFKLYVNHEQVDSVILGQETIGGPSYDVRFSNLMGRFLSKTISVETEVNTIAKLLADITKDTLRPAIDKRLRKEITQESGELYGAFTDLKSNLLHDLTEDQFVDMYAQTITYGLLAAKMYHDDDSVFDRKVALFDVPKSFGVLHAIFKFIATDNLPKKIESAMDEIIGILNLIDLHRILKKYYDEDRGKDWFVHFYETFLGEYDPKTRKSKGVYYTPDAVVGYITRSVNEILKTEFDKELGFGNADVNVLDPAVGTASFITSACQIGINEIKKSKGDGMVDGHIEDHILKHFYGFELMMTPYVLGHLKIKTMLNDNDYSKPVERINLFLGNTLDNAFEQGTVIESDIGRSVVENAKCIKRIKTKETILAVIGNPPYSGTTSNKRLFDNEIKLYKKAVKGEILIKPLFDDYVKFMRFAHKQIDEQGEGVIGFITNNSYLDGLVHRGMRKELLRSFDKIYILNLHGDTRKKEKTPDGSKDENVFSIMQGVSIILCVKTTQHTTNGILLYKDIFGLSSEKYKYLNTHDYRSTDWIELNSVNPYYFFTPKDFSMKPKYDNFISTSDIFKDRSQGVVTARDKLTIQDTKENILNVVNDFCNLDIETARQKYDLRKDSRDWKVNLAQKDIRQSGLNNELIKPILYRSFDIRYTYYTGNSGGFMASPGKKIMQHMMHDNIALLTCRQQTKLDFHHAFITDNIVDVNMISPTYVSPLYIYDNGTKTPNINSTIISKLTDIYTIEPTPEDIFYYIYGILHANIYRQKYTELLRIDFPKIPFTPDYNLFIKIGTIGKQLADLHLMKPEVFNQSNIKYQGRGDNKVEKITHDKSTERITINKKQYFEGITADIWEYQIGGYKPMQKWLKDRRHDNLTNDNVDHYRYIGAALEKTIALQSEIDTMYDEIDNGEIVQFDTGGYFKND